MPKSLGKLKVNSMGGVVPSIRMISIRFLHDRYKGWRTSLEPTISNMGICVYLDMYVYIHIYIYIQNAYIYIYAYIHRHQIMYGRYTYIYIPPGAESRV